MVEFIGITPAEIASKPELFQYNEYLRLTGQWFIPLPCHFWQFKKGMEFDMDYGDTQMISLTFFDTVFDDMFSAFINKYEWEHFHFSEIKRMRIKSFKVKNG
jgi:hypothetical protein